MTKKIIEDESTDIEFDYLKPTLNEVIAKLLEIRKKRYIELCEDLPEEEIQKMLEITGLDK